MKKIFCIVLLLAVATAGCAKKNAEKASVTEARKHLVEGTVFLKQGEVVKAVQSFATAIKTAPDYFESYYLLAEVFIRLKQFPQAQAVLAAAVKQFPDNGIAYYLLAIAHEGSGNLMPAIVAARKSLDLFAVKRDQEGAQRSTVLLAALVTTAKKQSEESMAQNAAKDAEKAAQTQEAEEAAQGSTSAP